MKILVTGSAGFIGSHLAERLHALGHTVQGVDAFKDYYARPLKQLNAADLQAVGIPTEEVDLAEANLAPLVADVEYIYHLAAQPGISATTPYDDYLRNNIIATHRLFEAARASGSCMGFLNIATSSIYGREASGPEENEAKPASHYGVTKLAAEQEIMACYRDTGFPGASFRLFSVYGPRERPEKLYPKLMHAILADKPFPLFEGSDKHIRSYTYVSDIIDGLVTALDRWDSVQGEIINLGTPHAITTAEGIGIVEDILGRKAKLQLTPKRPGDQLKTQANIDKARQLLDYDPKTSPRQGLEITTRWYQDKIFGKLDAD